MFMRLIRPAASLLVLMTVLLGIVYPLVITGAARLAFPRQAEGSLVHTGRQAHRLDADRPEFFRSEVLLGAAVRNGAAALQRPRLVGLELRSAESGAARRGQGERQGPARRRPGQPRADSGRTRDLVGERAGSGDQPGGCALPGRPGRTRAQLADCRRSRRLIAAHQRDRLLGLFGEPRINVLELNLALDHPRARRTARNRSTTANGTWRAP